MRSIRSTSRARTSRSAGFALISALALAILYFGLMELLLIDSSRALAEAQRFRSRTVAATLAENGAELAAESLVSRSGATVTFSDAQGQLSGKLIRSNSDFELEGKGTSAGVIVQQAQVRVQGRVIGTRVIIDYTRHSQ